MEESPLAAPRESGAGQFDSDAPEEGYRHRSNGSRSESRTFDARGSLVSASRARQNESDLVERAAITPTTGKDEDCKHCHDGRRAQ